MINYSSKDQQVMDDTALNDQEIAISFTDLPDSCFINPADRPLGTLVTLPILVRRNYKGIKIGKTMAGIPYNEASNLIRILTKQPISATFLLGEKNNTVELGKNVMGNFHLALWYNNQVSIGRRTTTNSLHIEARRSVISIGKDCMISEAWIQATDMHGVWGLDTKQSLNKAGYSITIEDGVWLGRRSSIVRPVTVGKGSIIAFGAVVTKDVPACSIVAGNPARVTKRNVTWTRNFKDTNELNERISSMNLEAELIELKPPPLQTNWLGNLKSSTQKLKQNLFRRPNPYG